MRNRTNSTIRLEYYHRVIVKTILQYQNPATGLLPTTPGHECAWVRENVYSILAVWALGLVYRKNSESNEDRAKWFELQQSVVKLMRGLLRSMMQQKDKVERFKISESPKDAIHAMFSVKTGMKVVGDGEWGHLQLDATSLYLLMLAEMTATGLDIIYTLDEVAFIQNLVFYIHSAYTTPDFGIWERGDKSNTGLPEISCTSVGMAKAALEALNELDLFGRKGSPASVIHVLPDDIRQCRAILNSVLPRESNSKETDAGLLSIISYPAFAVDDCDLINLTKKTIVEKLQGRYGLCRFLRDGYKAPREDPTRMFYEPWELQSFENIECEWPVFFAFLILDGLFNGKKDQVEEYSRALEEVLIKRDDGIKVIPELYAVPLDKVELECETPKSQEREPSEKLPLMWAQSLYVLGRLVQDGFLSPGEIDPLNRRLAAEGKFEPVIQVVFLAEDSEIKEEVLKQFDIPIFTFKEIAPICVYHAHILSYMYSHLGRNKTLGLSGIATDVAGILATSKVYSFSNHTILFLPSFMDQSSFYLVHDVDLMSELFKREMTNLQQNWHQIGRPILIMPFLRWIIEKNEGQVHPSIACIVKKLVSGYEHGSKIEVGTIDEFLNTSAWSDLAFLHDTMDYSTDEVIVKNLHRFSVPRRLSIFGTTVAKTSVAARRSSVVAKQIMENVARRESLIQRRRASIPSRRLRFGDEASSTISEKSIRSTTTTATSMENHLMESTAFDEKITSTNEAQYMGMNAEELLNVLQKTNIFQEQADIILYLFHEVGLDWKIENEDDSYTVADLMTELYTVAGKRQQWWIVRLTAGILGKQVEDLSFAATDIIIRQKQITVGLPPKEKIITRPIPCDELAALITEACGDDTSSAMLTQEVLVYLAMLFLTHPTVFDKIIRIRVGLIIQSMAKELSQLLKITVAKASQELFNFSPFQIQSLLLKLLSAIEFVLEAEALPEHLQKSPGDLITLARKRRSSAGIVDPLPDIFASSARSLKAMGLWLHRRQVDGSLSRAPVGFYPAVWNVLNRCPELQFQNLKVASNLTKESTPGEMKFAVQVESVLNQMPSPEYRQLLVEATMVICLLFENCKTASLETSIHVDEIVKKANELFLTEQEQISGDATYCCAVVPRPPKPPCKGRSGICQYFYDSAPTGKYGTMVYMVQAATSVVPLPIFNTDTKECRVQ